MKKITDRFLAPIIILILMVIAVIGAMIVRSKFGFWFDEMYSVWMGTKSFPIEFFKGLWEDDIHAPLYHLIINIFTSIFGVSFLKLQLMNLFLCIWTIPVIYLFGKKIFNLKTGYLAASILTFNILFLYGLCFVRFYTISGLIFLLSTYFIFRLMQDNTKKNMVLISVFNILLIYTLTLGSIYVLIQGLVFGIYFLYKRKDLVKPFLISSLITLIAVTPYAFVAFHHFMNTQMSIVGGHNALFSISYLEPIITLQDLFYKFRLAYKMPSAFLVIWNFLLVYFVIKSFALEKTEEKLTFSLFLSIFSLHTILCLLKKAPFNYTYCAAFLPLFILCLTNVIINTRCKLWKIIILCFLILPQIDIYTQKTKTMALDIVQGYHFAPLINTVKKYNLTEDDLFYSASSGKLLKPFGIKATTMDICHNAGFLIYNKERTIEAFGPEALNLKTKEEKEAFLEKYIDDKNIKQANRAHYEKMLSKTKVGSRIVINLAGHRTDNAYFKTLFKISVDMVSLVNQDKRLKFEKVEYVPVSNDPIFTFRRIK